MKDIESSDRSSPVSIEETDHYETVQLEKKKATRKPQKAHHSRPAKHVPDRKSGTGDDKMASLMKMLIVRN